MIGAVVNSDMGDIQFLVSRSVNSTSIESVASVIYEDNSDNYIWERGCLLRCRLPIKLSFCIPVSNQSDAEKMYLHAAELKDPQVVFLVERLSKDASEVPKRVILCGREMDFNTDLSDIKLVDKESSQDSDAKVSTCRDFCLQRKSASAVISAENADTIQVSLLLNRSEKCPKSTAPIAEYFPALEGARLLVVDFELDVLSYASKDLSLMYAVSKLTIPGLIDQLNSMKKAI